MTALFPVCGIKTRFVFMAFVYISNLYFKLMELTSLLRVHPFCRRPLSSAILWAKKKMNETNWNSYISAWKWQFWATHPVERRILIFKTFFIVTIIIIWLILHSLISIFPFEKSTHNYLAPLMKEQLSRFNKKKVTIV